MGWHVTPVPALRGGALGWHVTPVPALRGDARTDRAGRFDIYIYVTPYTGTERRGLWDGT